MLFAEVLQERRLANARFAGDQHEPPVRTVVDGGECVAESRKLTRTLQQLNGSVERTDCCFLHDLCPTTILYESKDGRNLLHRRGSVRAIYGEGKKTVPGLLIDD